MLFDLSKLHGQRAHFERTFKPSVSIPRTRITGLSAGRALDGRREGGQPTRFGSRARGDAGSSSSCGRCSIRSSCLSTRASNSGTCRRPSTAATRTSELAEDDLTTAFYSEGMLDVIDLLREQFQLALR